MDQELRDYLDQRFRSIDERFDGIDERFDGIDERFDGIDERFDGIDERFRGMDERFDGVDERFRGMDERFERLETDVRQTRVVVEGLEGQIKLVAEGVATVDHKLERFRGEVAEEFKEVRATMDLHYSHLDRRVKKLERAQRPPKLPSRASSG